MSNFWLKLNKPILALAPMADITDSAFRQICKKYGADVTYSEMASVSALFYSPRGVRRYAANGKAVTPQGKPQKTLELVKFDKKERPYVIQLFGKDPEHFAASARIISGADSPLSSGLSARPDGIDINFGCPAKKVFGHGSGCALMPQKKLAREIISAVCENTDLPVSLKIRSGIKDMSALEFIENTRDLPYSAVMVHARTYEGGFSGPVDFSVCEKIKKIIPNRIILANGGISTPSDAAKILRGYPLLDGLGIARGAWGRPFIFDEIKSSLSSSPVIRTGDSADTTIYNFDKTKEIMLEHAELIYENKGKLGLFEIRKHMAWYVKGFPGASELRRKLVTANSLKEIAVALKEM